MNSESSHCPHIVMIRDSSLQGAEVRPPGRAEEGSGVTEVGQAAEKKASAFNV